MADTIVVSRYGKPDDTSSLQVSGSHKRDGDLCNNARISFSPIKSRVTLGGGLCSTGTVQLDGKSSLIFAGSGTAQFAANVFSSVNSSARHHSNATDTPLSPNSIGVNEALGVFRAIPNGDIRTMNIGQLMDVFEQHPALASPKTKQAINDIKDTYALLSVLPGNISGKVQSGINGLTLNDINGAAQNIQKYIAEENPASIVNKVNAKLLERGEKPLTVPEVQAAMDKVSQAAGNITREYNDIPSAAEVKDYEKILEKAVRYDPSLRVAANASAAYLNSKGSVAFTAERAAQIGVGNIVYTLGRGVELDTAHTNTVRLEAGLGTRGNSLSPDMAIMLNQAQEHGNGGYVFAQQQHTTWSNMGDASRKEVMAGVGANSDVLGGKLNLEVRNVTHKDVVPGNTPAKTHNTQLGVVYSKKF